MKKKKAIDEVQKEILEYIDRFSGYRRHEEVSHKPTLAQMASRARESVSEIDKAAKRRELIQWLRHPSVQREVKGMYENVLFVIELIRDIKRVGLMQAIDDGLVASTCALILEYQPLNFVYLACWSEEFRNEVAIDFLAYSRDRYARRLKALKLLLVEPSLVEDLNLSDSMLEERIDIDSKSLAYLKHIRAGELKMLKMYCAFPILTILRLQGEDPIQRYRFIHNLLLFAEVPEYGNIPSESEIGEEEELERIKKWDEESVEWFEAL